MRPQSAKAKGRKLQQRVAREILARIAHESLTERDVVSTSMGAGGEDIKLSSAAFHFFPYSVECKNCERLNFWAAIEQCASNSPPTATPLVVAKRNNQEPVAVVPWQHFLDLALPSAIAAPAAAQEPERLPAIAAPAAAQELERAEQQALSLLRSLPEPHSPAVAAAIAALGTVA